MSEKKNYVNSVNLNADTDFPYLVMKVKENQSEPVTPGFHVMHWHEDLQLLFVEKGSVHVKTLEDEVILNEGDGILIGRNIVHMIVSYSSSVYYSILFPDRILRYYAGCPANAVIESVSSSLFYMFRKDDLKAEHIFDIVNELVELENNKNGDYVYDVLIRLHQLILLIHQSYQKEVSVKSPSAERMTRMLRYIEDHYAEDVSLTDLADSASISKTECLRCFKNSLGTTPYKYLLEYRLMKAAEMLRSTDTPIGDICTEVGFHQVSLFGKYFKEKTGQTPRKYRKNNEFD